MNKEIAIRKIIYHEIDKSTVTKNQIRMWALAGAGIGLNGYDLFIMSAALPLIQTYFSTYSPIMMGLLVGAAVFGAIPGAMIAGLLSDRFGRRPILLVDITLLTITSILCSLAWSPLILIFCRFLQGIAIGAEYPISASIVAEVMPQHSRGKWVTGAFSFQAVGMVSAAIVSTLILYFIKEDNAWRWMLLSCAAPSFTLAVLRQNIHESPRWLARRGKTEQAKTSLGWLLGPQAVQSVLNQVAAAENIDLREPPKGCLSDLFRPGFRVRTLLTAFPWFLMDISLYGIGLFTPAILVNIFHGPSSKPNGFLAADFTADAGAAFADLFLIVGFTLNILTVERLGRIKLQILGFVGMTVGTAIISLFGIGGSHLGLIIGFSIFNLMVNFGPNATTYLLPVELFPTELRSTGHGFAAACGKAGATAGAFLLPIAIHIFGLSQTMSVIGILSMTGAVITLLCRVETKGMALE